ncbi:MAG: GNAT family acetyltransferase [Lentisphaeria bacterium]|nr:hypothetical protein [Victivallales bacterium]MCR4572771.1 GNAT family acetyltransferase [Lentisphaeria bacterium]
MALFRVNILDLLARQGRKQTEELLQTFSCPLNTEIETFLWNKSIDFSLQKISITHLVFNEKKEIVAYFTLSPKAVSISCEHLSASLQKKLRRYGLYNTTTNSIQASAYLIAQFGKNAAIPIESGISGDRLMEQVFSILKDVQHNVGGGIAFLECENHPKLLDFYQNSHNAFQIYGERIAESQTKYIQLMHIFNEKTFSCTLKNP